MKRKSKTNRKRKGKVATFCDNAIGTVRQAMFPAEHRIAVPEKRDPKPAQLVTDPASLPPSTEARAVAPPPPPAPAPISAQALAEVATSLWYLKTKHFKREWDCEDFADDDPRVRRSLGRLQKGIDAINRVGIQVNDPTGKRYAPGSEGSMRPIHFAPTDGLDHQRVTETVTPVVYFRDTIIQRGEVFVAVPVEEPAAASAEVSPFVDAPVEPPPAATPEASEPATSEPASFTEIKPTND